MQAPEPQDEHRWLQRLVGDWTFESEMSMGPGQPPMTCGGSETVRSLGGLWTLGEGITETPEGGASRLVMTLGYDPQAGRFVGTFIASCMTYLWIYSGSLDEARRILTLDAEGPSLAADGTMAPYQDIIEFVSDDERTLRSRVRMPDGQWMQFMTARYRRK